ncbi:rhamnogalacturonan lyase family protein [Microcella flavibacter]|uniref:rhamnogalacturonan lyase family protein n=1 Tax=Microcella flavibacter TaxID=1804990 RepID=UPI001457914D|nr:hypothetical protein [Microcella flavibacter]
MALVTATAVASSLAVAAPAAAAEPFAGLRLDAGPAGAPLAAGFTALDRTMAYTPERGFGFVATGGLNDRNRGAAPGELGAMIGDFIISGAPFELVVDVPNGLYDITTWSGDLIASSQTRFTIEGRDAGTGNAASGFVTEADRGPVTVTDGQLNVVIGGNSSRFNGIAVIPALLAPAELRLVDLDVSAAQPTAELAWNPVDGASYRVLRTGEGDAAPTVLSETAEPTFTDTSARLGRQYRYAVIALDGTGRESVASNELVVSYVDAELAPPAAPTGLAVTSIEKNLVELGWQAEGEPAYAIVERASSAEGPWAVVAEVEGTSYRDTDVLTTIPYFYRVRSVNAGGASPVSEVLASEAVTVLQRQTEYLDRAPAAVPSDDGVLVSWRMLGDDAETTAFHVYRDGERITESPVTATTSILDAEGSEQSQYLVTEVVGDREVTATEPFGVWEQEYFSIPLDRPADGVTPGGQAYSYRANDASVGDVDGDGTYELIQMWEPSNARDNSQSGTTGPVYVDAYRFDGTKLWRIDLGRNIRAGAHYTMPQVFDYDGDGKAEVIMKTADATVDGTGVVIGDANADYRNSGGYILSGPEFLTLFDGETGAALDTIDYTPARGNIGSWGDTYGNRIDRFLAGTAYLNGETPSAIFSRGYYTRAVVAAYDVVDDRLVERWVLNSDDPGNGALYGQGNHNLSVQDVDGDGLDEIVFGSATIDDDGTLLYSTGLGHGDALHVGDHLPERDGLEVFAAHESMGESGNRGATMRDARTGEIIFGIPATRDTGRAATADIDARFPGNESWAIGGTGAFDSPVGTLVAADGAVIGTAIPAANFVGWWDGDPLREIVDNDYDATIAAGVPTIAKWNVETQSEDVILRAEGAFTNNTTKATPILQADLFGDWREELVWRSEDSSEARVYSTPHPSFFIGDGMEMPPAPPIVFTNAPEEVADSSAPDIAGVQDALLAESATLDLAVTAADPESGIRSLVVEFDGERVAADASIALDGLVGERTLTVRAVNNAGLSTEVSSTITVFADSGAEAAPARGVLTSTSGWEYGLSDGTFAIMMNLWWGENATAYRLYQDGVLVDTQLLTADSPNGQVASTRFSGLPDGRYVFTGELLNAAGTTATTSVTVVVRDAAPGTPVVSSDYSRDRDSDYTLTTNLWWGTNATEYRLLENGVVIDEQTLVGQTPLAQRATTSVTDREPGTYVYVAEFENAAGVTSSRELTVRVR